MDLSSDKGSIEASASNIEDDGKISRPKSCADCQTTKTPLWRGGPSGPKSLCNACGIRYQKTRKGSTGLKEEQQKKRRKKEKRMEEKMEMAFKLRLLGIGRDMVLKQRRSWLQRRRKLGEEEQAAVLLMALSSGFL